MGISFIKKKKIKAQEIQYPNNFFLIKKTQKLIKKKNNAHKKQKSQN